MVLATQYATSCECWSGTFKEASETYQGGGEGERAHDVAKVKRGGERAEARASSGEVDVGHFARLRIERVKNLDPPED